jgi:hypothetical protein
MPSQKGKRAKGVHMTEQHLKILQVTQDIVQMLPTADIVQMPATQDIVQIPPSQDILQMAAQLVDIRPLKRALGGNRYLEFKEWNGSKRVDLRFWKDGTVPTKEGVSLHLDQWKALCNMPYVIDDLLTSHRRRTSRLAIAYRRRRFRDDQGTLRLYSHQKALYSRR